MPAGTLDLVIEQDATFRMPIKVAGADGPFDLSAWTPAMQIRETTGELDVILDCRPQNRRLNVVDAAAGEMLLELSPSETGRLPGACVYDIVIHGSTNEVIRLLQGGISLSRSVTKPL